MQTDWSLLTAALSEFQQGISTACAQAFHHGLATTPWHNSQEAGHSVDPGAPLPLVPQFLMGHAEPALPAQQIARPVNQSLFCLWLRAH